MLTLRILISLYRPITLTWVGRPTLPQPFVAPNLPLQPHPSIMDILEPPLQPMHDGWDKNPTQPLFGIVHWPASPKNAPLPHVSTPIVASSTSLAHSSPKNDKMSFPEILGDKGKKLIEVLSIDTSQSTFVQSKLRQVKIDYEGRREIYFRDMHPKVF
jgi:hypothetical protein